VANFYAVDMGLEKIEHCLIGVDVRRFFDLDHGRAHPSVIFHRVVRQRAVHFIGSSGDAKRLDHGIGLLVTIVPVL
jgi:hypothetical protein